MLITQSRNLLSAFDESCTDQRKVQSRIELFSLANIFKDNIAKSQPVVVNKIRLFSTKFKSQSNELSTVSGFERNKSTDLKLKEMCESLHKNKLRSKNISSAHKITK